VNLRELISCPSSLAYAVSWRARYSGPSAIQMLRTPAALKTHATACPVGAATISVGKGADRTWSSVNDWACSVVVTATAASAFSTYLTTIS
jgi:hypothetical protein